MAYERHAVAALGFVVLGVVGCASSDEGPGNTDAAVGGNTANGGSASGGTASGGTASGGAAAGGRASGGSASGGTAAGGNGGRAAGGAPPGTGGTSQAGSGGASVDASSPSGCAGRSYAFCEDFESAVDGKLPAGWTKLDGWNQGEAVVTSAEHHGGMRALASAVAVNGQPRAAHSLTSLGATAGTHWGRIFYKVKTPFPLPKGGGVIHNTLVGLRGSSESRVVDTVVGSSGAHQFLYNLPDDSCCTGSAYDYHSYDGKWHCAEWYIDAATQSFRFFFEGTEVASLGFKNRPGGAARIEQFSSIAVGWINYQTPDPPYYQAWFDDLAIDDARVGCE